MAGLVRQECLACTRHIHPVCHGSGVRLVREPDGRVVDVQLCVRWPASWDEPLANWEALAEHDVDAVPLTAVPDKTWPAAEAEVVRTSQVSADHAEETWSDFGPARALVFMGAFGVIVVLLVVALVVLW